MSDSLRDVLQQSVEVVLEKMFFIRSLSTRAPESEPPEQQLAACVAFEGQPSGLLALRVTEAAARFISADFLGLDVDELSKQQVQEVVGELANMICGSVLSRVESAVTFRLARPLIQPGDAMFPDAPIDAEPCASHGVEIEGGTLTVTISTENPVCSLAKSRC